MIQAGEAKTEGKIWELIRKERKSRKKINEEIKIEDWKEYFMRLMEVVERKVVRGGGRKREIGRRGLRLGRN